MSLIIIDSQVRLVNASWSVIDRLTIDLYLWVQPTLLMHPVEFVLNISDQVQISILNYNHFAIDNVAISNAGQT